MGTPVPPIETPGPGELCENCWGTGGAFGAGPTPEFIRVEIEGVEKGPDWMPGDPEPPNGSYVLEQEPGFPCFFLAVVGIVELSVFFSGLGTTFTGRFTPAIPFWFLANEGPCVLVGTSILNADFKLGTATILL